MNGIHDMGGMHGFGPVPIERDEPLFHAEWERRMFGMAIVMWRKMGSTGPQLRGAIESLPPRTYLGSSYYERWLRSREPLLVGAGMFTTAELDARTRHFIANPGDRPARRDDAAELHDTRTHLAGRYPPALDLPIEPAFSAGDVVRVRNINPAAHTRVPRYARGRVGTVGRYHGVHDFEDAHQGDSPGQQPIYSVRFQATELWGDAADGKGAVNLDMWESHLESVDSESALPAEKS